MIPTERKQEKQTETRILKKKKKILNELVGLIEKNNTIMIASIVNLSSFQFQKLKRVLKGKADVKVVKKNIALKALEEVKSKKNGIEQLEQSIMKCTNFVFLLSDFDAFELAALLAENKKPGKIKSGQIAPQDIIIEAGPTDLPAGPVISDLSKVKIKAGIEGGKIIIKERAVLTKKGEKVSEEVASILAKLELMPLLIGIEPLAAYDSKEKKVYLNIKIDKTALINELKLYSQQAFALAIYFDYPTQETIKFLLIRANIQGNSILNLTKISETKSQENLQEVQTQPNQI